MRRLGQSASVRAEVESLGVKIEAVGPELETREKALQSAMADLGRATALHKDLSERDPGSGGTGAARVPCGCCGGRTGLPHGRAG